MIVKVLETEFAYLLEVVLQFVREGVGHAFFDVGQLSAQPHVLVLHLLEFLILFGQFHLHLFEFGLWIAKVSYLCVVIHFFDLVVLELLSMQLGRTDFLLTSVGITHRRLVHLNTVDVVFSRV